MREVFARPEYDWVQTARPLHWLRDLWMRFRAWLDAFATQHPLGAKLLFWGALVALIALLVHIGLTVWRIYQVTVQQPAAAGAAPAAELLDSRGHLARAESLARAGRYTEALAHRFLALLLELDRADALTFHPSKTPAEYVREARLGAAGRATLAGLVSRLYHHVFGAEPLDERGYREFGAAAGSLLQHVASH
ncbi:MAG TPA: DUF4129 domain-containing protein [Gemmatimonadales bacterium]|nr:DUF4129 domain-containing protein [Gemmatimonadales bacterium]